MFAFLSSTLHMPRPPKALQKFLNASTSRSTENPSLTTEQQQATSSNTTAPDQQNQMHVVDGGMAPSPDMIHRNNAATANDVAKNRMANNVMSYDNVKQQQQQPPNGHYQQQQPARMYHQNDVRPQLMVSSPIKSHDDVTISDLTSDITSEVESSVPSSSGKHPLSDSHLANQIYRHCKAMHAHLGTHKYERGITIEMHEHCQTVSEQHLGFRLVKMQHSALRRNGVRVQQGCVKKHTFVALYPGTVYRPTDPAMRCSQANPFLYRSSKGVIVDGCAGAMSMLMYRSCSFRSRHGSHLCSDQTWLSELPANPIAIGNHVRTTSDPSQANVYYQEIELPLSSFPDELRRYIPNVEYHPVVGTTLMRLVALVSLRQIQEGEQLYVYKSDRTVG